MLLGRARFYTPNDAIFAQFGAIIEAIHCGITTVLDHSHVQLSEEHIRKCIYMTVETGIHSVYCFAPMTLPTTLNPLTMLNPISEHTRQMDLFYKLAEEVPVGGKLNDGRGRLELGCYGLQFRPLNDTQTVFDFARDRRMPITLHDCAPHDMPALKFCRENNLKSEMIVFSHASCANE